MHVHTDDPGAALSLGTAAGTIDGRRDREHARAAGAAGAAALRVVPTGRRARASGVVAVVAGAGNRKLFESLAEPVGPIRIVEGGQTSNPSTAELLAALEELDAEEAILLPNNPNVRLAAEQAAERRRSAGRGRGDGLDRRGLAALVAYDGARGAAENAAEMAEAAAASPPAR